MLVEIEENLRATPQIVGEAEWMFGDLERRERLALAIDEEVNVVV